MPGTAAQGRARRRSRGVYVLFAATYLPINHFSVGRNAGDALPPGEERLPSCRSSSTCMSSRTFFPCCSIVTVRDYAPVRRLSCAHRPDRCSVAYTTYLVFPVYFERPHLEVTRSTPGSCRSSIWTGRTTTSRACTWRSAGWRFSRRRCRAIAGRPRALAVGISVSTVFVKQHYVVDVLYGFALAWIAWRLARPRVSGR